MITCEYNKEKIFSLLYGIKILRCQKYVLSYIKRFVTDVWKLDLIVVELSKLRLTATGRCSHTVGALCKARITRCLGLVRLVDRFSNDSDEKPELGALGDSSDMQEDHPGDRQTSKVDPKGELAVHLSAQSAT